MNMQLYRMIHRGWLGVCLCISLCSAQAEVAIGRAEHLYGPDTTQNEACNLATKKAVSQAISQVLGEYVSAQEILSCKGSTGKKADYACELNQLSWSQIDGHVNKTINQETITANRDGAMVCTAVVKLDVAIPKTKPDPNFQLRATINANTFRVRQKDEIRVELELSQPGYYAVFNWQPHIDNTVYYLELNPKKPKMSAPIETAKSLEFLTSWSDAYSNRRTFYDEYLIVVASKKELRWLSKYSYEEFSKALHLIPENEKRLAKIAVQLTNE
jgi:hypothetical protein